MAHAVAPAQARWRGTVASLDQVDARIGELTRKLGGDPAGGRTGSTTCCLDLVVRVADDDADVARVVDVIGQLAPSHPLRAVVVRTSDGASALDVEVLCEAYGRGVQRQEVVLTLPSDATARLAEQVSTLLVPGVPVYVWSVLAPELRDPEGVDALSAATALIVDTAAHEDAVAIAGDLRRFAARGGTVVADLSWARTRRWREALASFFAPVSRRPLIRRVATLGVDHGAGSAGTIEGALLVGWLASRLGYALDGVDAGADGLAARYRGDGGEGLRVEVSGAGLGAALRSVDMRGPGFHLGVRVESDAVARLHFTIERTVTQHLSWAVPTEAQLLAELLVDATHDTVYPAALAAAVDLLEART